MSASVVPAMIMKFPLRNYWLREMARRYGIERIHPVHATELLLDGSWRGLDAEEGEEVCDSCKADQIGSHRIGRRMACQFGCWGADVAQLREGADGLGRAFKASGCASEKFWRQ